MVIKSIHELRNYDCNLCNIISNNIAFEHNSLFDYLKNSRSNYLLHYIIDKNATRNYILADGSTFTAKNGDIIFVPSLSKYQTLLQTSDGKSANGIGIAFDIVSSDQTPILMEQAPTIIDSDKNDVYLHLFLDVYHEYARQNENYFPVKLALLKIFNFFYEKKLSINKLYKTLEPAFEYIESHLSDKISSAMLGDMCFLSETHFRRLFKEYTNGLSPKAYILKLKLNIAEELADNSNYSIEQIAEKLDFFDSSALCNVFKQKKGYTLKFHK